MIDARDIFRTMVSSSRGGHLAAIVRWAEEDKAVVYVFLGFQVSGLRKASQSLFHGLGTPG